jgi:hypothetical protein
MQTGKSKEDFGKEVKARMKKRSTSDGSMVTRPAGNKQVKRMDAQAKEEAAEHKMVKRLKTKSEGVRNTKKFLG